MLTPIQKDILYLFPENKKAVSLLAFTNNLDFNYNNNDVLKAIHALVNLKLVEPANSGYRITDQGISFKNEDDSLTFDNYLHTESHKESVSKISNDIRFDNSKSTVSSEKEDIKGYVRIRNDVFAIICGALIPIIGGAYFLGKENGSTKFDEKKIEMSDKIKTLENELQSKKDSIQKLWGMWQLARNFESEYYRIKAAQLKALNGRKDSLR